MSVQPAVDTGTRRAPRLPVTARPTRAEWVDGAGAFVATLVAVSAFAGTYDGWGWAGSVALAAAFGVVIGLVVVRRSWSWLLGVPILALVTILVFPILGLRGTPSRGAPTPGAIADIGQTLVGGWRDLLTTLPPVDGSGPLLLLPFVLALGGAYAALVLARRVRSAHAPFVAPVVVGALAVLLGVQSAVGIAVRAVLALVVLLAWGAARDRRLVVSATGDACRRVLAAAGVIAVAAVVAAAATPLLGSSDRTVWRDDVAAPVDLTNDPSPLAAFRSFRPGGAVTDTPLLNVSGLPDGMALRLAVVDAYAGTVWAAGDATATGTGSAAGFLRVGSRIPQTVQGPAATVSVRVEPGWATHPQLRVWVPTLGHDTGLTFGGPTADARDEDLRYSPATGAAVATQGLQAGDTYTISAIVPAVSDGVVHAPIAAAVGAGPAPVASAGFSAVAAPLVAQSLTSATGAAAAGTANAADAGATAANPAAGDPVAQVRAVAERLRTNGFYSDGGPGEETVLPGHSVGRLSAFLAKADPVGDDEQYAAALALAAAHLGLPSRVVLAAVPGTGGVVTGADIRAWVEVQTAPGSWLSLAPDEFVPPRDKKPVLDDNRTDDRASAAIVPPPNALRPPSSDDGFALDDVVSGRQRQAAADEGFVLPAWARVVLVAAGVPLGFILGFAALVIGAKAGRRLLRSRRGSTTDRVHGGWREVLDTLRDSGEPVSALLTRREVATRTSNPAVAEAAALVDAADYGPVPPSDDDVARLWEVVDRVRDNEKAARVGRDGMLAAVDPRSLLPGRAGQGRMRPSRLQEERVHHTVTPVG